MTDGKQKLLRQTLMDLERTHGMLSPALVVKEARREASPLHDYFEWDLNKAAEAHWLDRARELIRSVRVEVTVDDRVVESVYYVRDPLQEPEVQGYVSVDALRTDADRARAVLAHEFSAAEAYLRRAEALAAVVNMQRETKQVVARVRKLRERVTAKQELST